MKTRVTEMPKERAIADLGTADEPGSGLLIAERLDHLFERRAGFAAVEEMGDQFAGHVNFFQPPKPRSSHDAANQIPDLRRQIGSQNRGFIAQPAGDSPAQQIAQGRVVQSVQQVGLNRFGHGRSSFCQLHQPQLFHRHRERLPLLAITGEAFSAAIGEAVIFPRPAILSLLGAR